MTVGEWIDQARRRLEAVGIESARLEAQLLAGHVLHVERAWILSHPEAEFPSLAGESLLQRRERSEPLAYILGWREFYGRRFAVRPGVLIPRQETETLIEAALAFPGGRVFDLGTGSGCIGVTLKLERPNWEVVATDVSALALEIATQNAADLGANVEFVASDAFEALLGESFDLIVTNPPYIALEEELEVQVAGFEPQEALFGGKTGLEFYRMLASRGDAFLRDGGLLLMEVGHRQAGPVAELFTQTGWRHIETKTDLSGIERVVVVQPVFECLAPHSASEPTSEPS